MSENAGRTRATAVITVHKYEPSAYDEPAQGPVLTRIHAGTVGDNIVSGDWFAIVGSGTGQLAGLRGEGGFRANLGEGAQVRLDYWFE
jgi:Protein of unknown function (DUF3224)